MREPERAGSNPATIFNTNRPAIAGFDIYGAKHGPQRPAGWCPMTPFAYLMRPRPDPKPIQPVCTCYWCAKNRKEK